MYLGTLNAVRYKHIVVYLTNSTYKNTKTISWWCESLRWKVLWRALQRLFFIHSWKKVRTPNSNLPHFFWKLACFINQRLEQYTNMRLFIFHLWFLTVLNSSRNEVLNIWPLWLWNSFHNGLYMIFSHFTHCMHLFTLWIKWPHSWWGWQIIIKLN